MGLSDAKNMGTQWDRKMPKRGVNRGEVPYHRHVQESPPPRMGTEGGNN